MGGDDRVTIYGQTTQDRSIVDGFDDRTGPTNFLDVATPLEDRELTGNTIPTGETHVDSEIYQGFVMAPDGKAILANSEGSSSV